MKKWIINLLAISIILIVCLNFSFISAHAEDKKETLKGSVYELDEKDEYEISKARYTKSVASRFYVLGDISEISTKNGFTSYAVNQGNIKILVDEAYGEKLFDPKSNWHIVSDKTNTVDSTELSDKVGSGAIIVQTSKDGKTWITTDYETDFYSKLEDINSPVIDNEKKDSFYETTNVQLVNGCYYRIIVAYKLQRELEPSNIWFIDTTETEEKEQIEVYEFYAYDSSVNQAEKININDDTQTCSFYHVYRVDSQDGFDDPKEIDTNDPHKGWNVGKFYVSGFTAKSEDGDGPVFLKVPGDRITLWFNLEQEIDKCNGDTGIKIKYTSSGYDNYFDNNIDKTTIEDLGRGVLYVQKKGEKPQRYTNYLEASATVGANTRVDLFEEGDYEVALDYQLHYDKPFVIGTTTKTLSYRIFFKFKVRNGDISAFIRDADTGQFISNANVAKNGFYIDVANSKYLKIFIKREVITDSMDGLVEDVQFSGVAKANKPYTEEGIYTVTVINETTGDSVEKKVYVGDEDVLRAHMATGLSISEIKEKLAAGAYVDENGQIIDAETEETTEEIDVGGDSTSVKNDSYDDPEHHLGNKMNSDDESSFVFLLVVAIIVIGLVVIIVVRAKKKRKGKRKRNKEDRKITVNKEDRQITDNKEDRQITVNKEDRQIADNKEEDQRKGKKEKKKRRDKKEKRQDKKEKRRVKKEKRRDKKEKRRVKKEKRQDKKEKRRNNKKEKRRNKKEKRRDKKEIRQDKKEKRRVKKERRRNKKSNRVSEDKME